METTYQDFIQNILNTRGRFVCGEEYHERHHIVPKCMGGSNEDSNLIDLFAREHFEAHRLLSIENPDVYKLSRAWWMMANMNKSNHTNRRYYPISANEYEEAKIAFSNSVKGKKASEETRAKLREVHKGKAPSDYAIQRAIEVHKGIPFTEEHRQHLSESHIGVPLSERHKEKIKLGAVNKIKVVQINLVDGTIIREYESIAEASEITGIDRASISKCAKGERKSAGGFIWKYI